MKNTRQDSERQIGSTYGQTTPQHGVKVLQRLWQQAVEDSSPGINPDVVFDRLQRKYLEMASLR